MLIAVIIGIALCSVAVIHGFNLAIRRIRGTWMRQHLVLVVLTAIFLIPVLAVWLLVLVARALRIQPEGQSQFIQRWGELLEASFPMSIGLYFMALGIFLFFVVLPTSTVFVLLFGLGLPAVAIVALRRQRRWRQRLIGSNHQALARFYHLIVLAAVAAGILILVYGF